MTNETMSPADFKALMGTNNCGGLFNGDGSYFLLILFLFAFLGWGNGGGYGGAQGGVSENYTLISDMGQIERKIDGVYSGICDSTFALNNTITNGFASAQSTMTQGFAGIQGAVKDCCCQTQSAMKDVNYNIATQANGITNAVNTGFCQTNFNNQQNTRDLLENQNANARAILDAINANKVEALKDRIAEQNQTINALNLARSQSEQNEYLISQLKPCPTGAYLVANPYGALNYNLNNGCGCNC